MFYIVTCNRIPGYHAWENAPDHLDFLRQRHRHVFFIRCRIPVSHGDRELEIIETENHIQRYLLEKYGTGKHSTEMELGGLSCEQLAQKLAETFGASEVEVLEDGMGGAGYVHAG